MGYYGYVPNTHYYNPLDIHLHSTKQEKWNKITCWLCGKIGHTSSRCPEGEESKKNRGKKSEAFIHKGKQVKQEGRGPIQCMKCGSHTRKTERYPNIVIRELAQQHQFEESSYDSFSSSSQEELQAEMQQCSESDSSECLCSNYEECACQVHYDSDSEFFSESSEEETPKPQKEKFLMAATEEYELNILAQIYSMEEGEMKNRLTKAFMDHLSHSSLLRPLPLPTSTLASHFRSCSQATLLQNNMHHITNTSMIYD